jgi:hypothetical protein
MMSIMAINQGLSSMKKNGKCLKMFKNIPPGQKNQKKFDLGRTGKRVDKTEKSRV